MFGVWVQVDVVIQVFDIGIGIGVIVFMLVQCVLEVIIYVIDIDDVACEQVGENFVFLLWEKCLFVIQEVIQDYVCIICIIYDFIVFNLLFFFGGIFGMKEECVIVW